MTHSQIHHELSERAAIPAPVPPPGMTDQEEQAWLQNVIDQRRAELGIDRDARQPNSSTGSRRLTSRPKSELSAPSCCSRP